MASKRSILQKVRVGAIPAPPWFEGTFGANVEATELTQAPAEVEGRVAAETAIKNAAEVKAAVVATKAAAEAVKAAAEKVKGPTKQRRRKSSKKSED